MSEHDDLIAEALGLPTVPVYIPEGVVETVDMTDVNELAASIPHIIGYNVRLRAHDLWHEMNDRDSVHPTERAVILAQMQSLVDYADDVDPVGKIMTRMLKREFGWLPEVSE